MPPSQEVLYRGQIGRLVTVSSEVAVRLACPEGLALSPSRSGWHGRTGFLIAFAYAIILPHLSSLSTGIFSLFRQYHKCTQIKSLAEFRRRSGEKYLIVFDRDMSVGENTSRLANVRVVRLQRAASALQQAAAFSKKSHSYFFET